MPVYVMRASGTVTTNHFFLAMIQLKMGIYPRAVVGSTMVPLNRLPIIYIFFTQFPEVPLDPEMTHQWWSIPNDVFKLYSHQPDPTSDSIFVPPEEVKISLTEQPEEEKEAINRSTETMIISPPTIPVKAKSIRPSRSKKTSSKDPEGGGPNVSLVIACQIQNAQRQKAYAARRILTREKKKEERLKKKPDPPLAGINFSPPKTTPISRSISTFPISIDIVKTNEKLKFYFSSFLFLQTVTKMLALKAEHQRRDSYLSTIVRDVINMVGQYLRATLYGLSTDRVVETLTRFYPESLPYIARMGPGEFFYLRRAHEITCDGLRFSVSTGVEKQLLQVRSVNIFGEDLMIAGRHLIKKNYRTGESTFLGELPYTVRKIITLNQKFIVYEAENQGLLLYEVENRSLLLYSVERKEMRELGSLHQFLFLNQTHYFIQQAGMILGFDLESFKLEFTFSPPEEFNLQTCVCVDHLIGTALKGQYLVYDLRTGRLVLRIPLLLDARNRYYLYQREGQYYLVGTSIANNQITYHFYE